MPAGGVWWFRSEIEPVFITYEQGAVEFMRASSPRAMLYTEEMGQVTPGHFVACPRLANSFQRRSLHRRLNKKAAQRRRHTLDLEGLDDFHRCTASHVSQADMLGGMLGDDSAQEFNANVDLYNLLGLAAHATDDEIRRAFRKVSLKIHPDKGGDPAAWADVRAAVDILLNHELRRIYDSEGHSGLANHEANQTRFELSPDTGGVAFDTEPDKDWVELPQGSAVSSGNEVRFDMSTGRMYLAKDMPVESYHDPDTKCRALR